jgi:hypothetical protein
MNRVWSALHQPVCEYACLLIVFNPSRLKVLLCASTPRFVVHVIGQDLTALREFPAPIGWSLSAFTSSPVQNRAI